MIDNEPKTEPAAMTKTQLAALYKICPETLVKWLKPYDIETLPGTNIFTPAQVKTIFEKIGEP